MKIPTITLIPNRSNPRRYSRIVAYGRGADERGEYVVPLRITDGRVDQIRFHDIQPSAVDPEFAEAWADHVRHQRALARE